MKSRVVEQIVTGIKTTDGAGVNLRRIIGSPELNLLDPFLLLDEFKSDDKDDYIAGFPSHPHRGFETVTYLMHGAFRHRDSKGNEGHLRSGSVQWMTAGRGIIHSEMPEQEDGQVWGYQLWVNLPQKYKMTEPRYQDIPAEKIPVVEENGRMVKIIAGEYDGVEGPAESFFPISYFDVTLEANSSFRHPEPTNMNGFIYCYEGEVSVGPEETKVPVGRLAVMGDGDTVELSAGEAGGAFLFLAGERLEEPIARGGPFVMNTKGEVKQAFLDYQNGVLDK